MSEQHPLLVVSVYSRRGRRPYPLSQDLVDGGALLHVTLGHHFGPLFPHVQHERVQRFLDVKPLVVFFFVLTFRHLCSTERTL